MDCSNMPRVESSSEAPSHLRLSVGLFPSLEAFSKVFSKVCGGFLAKYCTIGPGRSPLIIASMTIVFSTVGAWALSCRNLRTYACKYSS
jgi:hypothetical protein